MRNNLILMLLFFLVIGFVFCQEDELQASLLKISQLRKDESALPTLLEIVNENPTVEVAQVAGIFLLEMDPKIQDTVACFFQLSFHNDPKIASAIQGLFFKAKEDWVFAVREILKNSGKEERAKSAILLVKQGANEIDTFAELLEATDEDTRSLAEEKLLEISKVYTILIIQRLVELVEINPNPNLQQSIVSILKTIGKKNISNMILVYKETSSEFGRNFIRQILESFGQEFVVAGIETLQNNLDNEIKNLLKSIFKKTGVKVIPQILNFLGDRRVLVRNLVFETIKSFGEEAVIPLTEIINNGTRDEQKMALEALAILGTDAKSAFPIIKPFLNKRNDLQYPALYALSMMGDASKEAVEDLKMVVRVSGRDYLIRATAADCLANAGIAAQDALPVFLERLKFENEDFKEPVPEVRKSICDAIGNIGSGAIKAVPTLIICLSKDTDENVVRAAAEAIGKIASKTEGSPRELQDAIDPLVQVFVNFGNKEMQAAAFAIAQIAKSNTTILNNKILRMLQTHRNPTIRLGIASSFRHIGKNAQLLLSRLSIVARTDDSDLVRQELAIAFSEIGPLPGSISPLVEMVRDESFLVRTAAIRSLGKMGVQAVGYILPALVRYNNDSYRIAYIQSLGLLGEDALSASGHVAQYLNSSNLSIQKEAIKTLGSMGPKVISSGKTPLTKLLQIIRETNDPEVYEIVQNTLVQFGPQIFEEIFALLREPNQQIQQLAIFVLDKLSGGNLAELTKIIVEGKDPFLTAQLIPIIGKNPATLDILLRKLNDPNTVVKNALVDTIAKIGIPAIPKLIQTLLSTEDAEVLHLINRILSKIGNPAVPAILSALKFTENKIVKIALINTLGDMGMTAQKAILPLIDYLKKWENEDQLVVAKNLGKIGVPAIPYLVRLLYDPNKKIQQAAIVALEETKSPIAIEYLLKTLKDPHWLSQVISACVKMKNIAVPVLINFMGDSNEYIRFACASSLMEIGDNRAVEAMQRQMTNESNYMIKYVLQKGIEKIQDMK